MNWRLIDTGSLDGLTNMAIDEALLACFDPEKSAPVLRLYGWNPPALSSGRFQDVGAILDLDRCRDESVPVVRRITGGGVIYHADELTYSIVCAPHHLPACATIKESFRILTGFLLTFYRSFGIPAAFAIDAPPSADRLGERTPFCFAGRESYDIIVAGRKIGGNAQRRLKNVIFQHGSIPVADHAVTGAGYLVETPEGIAAATASLGTFGIAPDLAVIRSRLAGSFESCLQVRLIPASLSEEESGCAGKLLTMKYADNSWNLQGKTA